MVRLPVPPLPQEVMKKLFTCGRKTPAASHTENLISTALEQAPQGPAPGPLERPVRQEL
jgi:hypothetical protein